MANEITESASLIGSKAGTTVTGNITKQRTLNGSQLYADVQTIGTTAEVLSFPTDLTTEGISRLWLANLDATNYVEFALDSGMTQVFARINAGDGPIAFRPYSGNPTYYARANTAAVNVQKIAVGT